MRWFWQSRSKVSFDSLPLETKEELITRAYNHYFPTPRITPFESNLIGFYPSSTTFVDMFEIFPHVVKRMNFERNSEECWVMTEGFSSCRIIYPVSS